MVVGVQRHKCPEAWECCGCAAACVAAALAPIMYCFCACLLPLQDYLERFKELILTASGLDMQPARSAQPLPLGPDRRQLLLTAA
jgi:hypothetical protein